MDYTRPLQFSRLEILHKIVCIPATTRLNKQFNYKSRGIRHFWTKDLNIFFFLHRKYTHPCSRVTRVPAINVIHNSPPAHLAVTITANVLRRMDTRARAAHKTSFFTRYIRAIILTVYTPNPFVNTRREREYRRFAIYDNTSILVL